MIKSMSKIKMLKVFNDYLIRNKRRIKSIDIEFAKTEPIQITSTETKSKYYTNEIITITLASKTVFKKEETCN